MPINNLIATGIKPPELRSPLNSMLKVQEMRRGQQQEQLNSLEMEKYRREQADAPRLAAQKSAQTFFEQVVPSLAKLPPEQRHAAFEQARAYGQSTGEVMDFIPPTYDSISHFVDAAAALPPMNAHQVATTTETNRHNLQTESAANKPPQFQPRAPIAVIGPDGNPMYVQPDDAIGKPPAQTSSGLTYAQRLALKGFRENERGGQDIIPGSPADPAVKAASQTEVLSAKDRSNREEKYPAAVSTLKTVFDKFDDSAKAINELVLNEDGLDEITGYIAGRTDWLAMSDEGRRALALYNNIIAAGGFKELADMRDASPTGGALGNVSDTEGRYLREAFAALGRTQSGDDVRKTLTELVERLERSRSNLQDAFDLTYDYRKSGQLPDSALKAPGGGEGEWGIERD